MDKEQLERLLSLSQITSGLIMLYAFLEEGVIFDELPDELRDDTKSLYESLERLGKKFSAYTNAAINNIVRTDNP